MRRMAFIVFLVFPYLLSAQQIVEGNVKSKADSHPLESAVVIPTTIPTSIIKILQLMLFWRLLLII
jgi:hypothetical protein